MSITPIDKPPDGHDGSDTPQSRRSSSLRKYVGRFVSWCVERVVDSGLIGGSPDDPQAGGPPVSVQSNEPSSRTRRSSDIEAFDDVHGREQPLTHPSIDSPRRDSPEVVSVETEQGLRLSVPENPDATLTSDVWTSVDP